MKVDLLKLIEQTGALHKGHFVLTSGRHIGRYVNKDAVSAYPRVVDTLAKNTAKHFTNKKIDVVAASATGAIVFGNRVAQHLGSRVNSVFAEQKDGVFSFRRDYASFINQNTKVLIVDDIVTTGKTSRAMIKAVKKLGVEILGIGLIWDGGNQDFGIPTFACITDAFEHYSMTNCPLCKKKERINTKINKHGDKFLEKYGNNPSNWPTNRKKL